MNDGHMNLLYIYMKDAYILRNALVTSCQVNRPNPVQQSIIIIRAFLHCGWPKVIISVTTWQWHDHLYISVAKTRDITGIHASHW